MLENIFEVDVLSNQVTFHQFIFNLNIQVKHGANVIKTIYETFLHSKSKIPTTVFFLFYSQTKIILHFCSRWFVKHIYRSEQEVYERMLHQVILFN